MTVMLDDAPGVRVESLAAAVEGLLSVDLARLSDAEVLALAGAVETAQRRLETFDHVLIPEVRARNIAGRQVVRGVHRVLASVWNPTPAQADPRGCRPRSWRPACR